MANKGDDCWKTYACVDVLYRVHTEMLTQEEAGLALREKIGLGWSLLSAMQFLTGRKAYAVFKNWETMGLSGEISRTIAGEMLLLAHVYCANASQHGTISNGLGVQRFRVEDGPSVQEQLERLMGAQGRPSH